MFLIRHSVAGLLLLAATVALCPAQNPSPQPPGGFGTDGAARVTQMTGQVSVLKDSGPWALQIGSQVFVRQIILTGADGFAVFEVSDGSTFEVYPNSRVTFRANPGNWKDLIDVWLGRVKIHIEKIGGQPNNNRIRTPSAVISVRGTTFDVAVEEEESTLVSVVEGEVEVQHALFPTRQPKLLGKGEHIRVYRDQPLVQATPGRDAAVQQGLRAAAEALYRIIYRAPSASGGSPLPGGGGAGSGGAPLPGDTENKPPPPPPPPQNQ